MFGEISQRLAVWRPLLAAVKHFGKKVVSGGDKCKKWRGKKMEWSRAVGRQQKKKRSGNNILRGKGTSPHVSLHERGDDVRSTISSLGAGDDMDNLACEFSLVLRFHAPLQVRHAADEGVIVCVKDLSVMSVCDCPPSVSACELSRLKRGKCHVHVGYIRLTQSGEISGSQELTSIPHSRESSNDSRVPTE
ncbi:hypothetical protein JOB18_042708 [Solea senegalensis]|uniref:Uncharacterized protein n=1 Tax=Solea senegalensis TaxID=28829 RepID=A0AAV6RES7_SOLSE|nr:hypothetical protein JOB18_042708 [Solea senegalensis]